MLLLQERGGLQREGERTWSQEGHGNHPSGRRTTPEQGSRSFSTVCAAVCKPTSPGMASHLVQELRANVKWGDLPIAHERLRSPTPGGKSGEGAGSRTGNRQDRSDQVRRPAAEMQGDPRVLCQARLGRKKRIFICSVSSHFPVRDRTRPLSFPLFL